MRATIFSFFILIFSVFFFSFQNSHPIHLSILEGKYYKSQQLLGFSLRVFADDTERILSTYAGKTLYLCTEDEVPEAERIIENYLAAHLHIQLNHQPATLEYVGKKLDRDVIVLYFQIADVDAQEVKSFTLKNTFFMETFSDQRNILNLTLHEERRSLMLDKGEPEGEIVFE